VVNDASKDQTEVLRRFSGGIGADRASRVRVDFSGA